VEIFSKFNKILMRFPQNLKIFSCNLTQFSRKLTQFYKIHGDFLEIFTKFNAADLNLQIPARFSRRSSSRRESSSASLKRRKLGSGVNVILRSRSSPTFDDKNVGDFLENRFHFSFAKIFTKS
jgi:hypothetical protein